VRLKCENSRIKQPKLLSPDAFSELEMCQNALAAGDLPRTPLQKLTYRILNSVMPSGRTFLVKKGSRLIFNTNLDFSISYVYITFTMCKILSEVGMFNTMLNLQNESKSTLRNQA